MTSPFVLSIAPTGKPSYQHGCHLGTEEPLARQIAVEIFRSLNDAGNLTCTVALMRDRKILDVYDGAWNSARAQKLSSPFDKPQRKDETPRRRR